MSQTQTLTRARSTGAGRQKFGTLALGGRAAVGYVYSPGVAVDHETLTIGTRVYEFVTTLGTGTAGNVEVDVVADQTADYACAALVVAINGDASRVVDAVAWVGNTDVSAGVNLVAHTEGDANPVLVEATTNFVVSAAALTGADVGALAGVWAGQYTVTAADVTALALAAGNEVVLGGIVAAARAPVLIAVDCLVGGTVVKSLATATFTVRNVVGQHYVLTVDDGIALLAAGDVLSYLLAY